MGPHGEGGILGVAGSFGVGERLAKRARGVERRAVVTAYGSFDVVMGTIDGGRFAALEKSRAAPAAPHQIAYRGVALALHKAGATRILSTGVGTSLSERLKMGDILVPDDYIDLSGRTDTLYGGGIEGTHHAEMDEPFCSRTAREYAATARSFGLRVIEGGTTATLAGPQHPTSAESGRLTSMGAVASGFTAATEAKLARELGMCFVATIVMVRGAPEHARWRGAAPPKGAAQEPTEQELLRAFAQGKSLSAPLASAPKVPKPRRGRSKEADEAEALVATLRQVDARLEEAAAAFVAQAAALSPCTRCPRGAGPRPA